MCLGFVLVVGVKFFVFVFVFVSICFRGVKLMLGAGSRGRVVRRGLGSSRVFRAFG